MQTQFLQFDLGYSPLQAGLRILPVAALIVRERAVVAGHRPHGRGQVHRRRRPGGDRGWAVAGLRGVRAATTYGDVVPGLLLIGLGAGLFLPTATNSVVGSVPQGDSGIGSAANAVALQVGGALGVAVIGSVLSTRYQDHMTTALAGRHVPAAVSHTILGSLGGALGGGGTTSAAPPVPCLARRRAPRS